MDVVCERVVCECVGKGGGGEEEAAAGGGETSAESATPATQSEGHVTKCHHACHVK